MREFKFQISADVKELEKQFEAGAKEVARFAKGVSDAENKLEKLQETAKYIHQIDEALAKVANTYPDVFEKIFGNVDKMVSDALSPIANMTKEMDVLFTQVGNKLQRIIRGEIKGTESDIDDVIMSMRTLAKSLKLKIDFDPFEDMLDDGKEIRVIANGLADTLKKISNHYTAIGKSSTNASKAQTNTAAATEKMEKRAKAAREEFERLTEEIKQGWLSGEMSDLDLGQNIVKLENVRKTLKALEKQGYITADAMRDIDEAYTKSQEHIAQQKAHNQSKIDGEPSGSYEKGRANGYDRGYEEGAASMVAHLQEAEQNNAELNEKLIQTESKLNEAQDEAKRMAEELERAKEAALQLDAALKGSGKRTEGAITYNSQTGEYGDAIRGGNHQVGMPSSSGGKYDTEMHSHPWDFAAPSVEDFDIWIDHFDEFQKFVIRANKEILSLDFSSLNADGLKNIRDQYAAALQKIDEEFGKYASDINLMNEKFGSYDGWQNAVQQAMQNALKGILDPKMFTTIDFQKVIEQAKPKKIVTPLAEQYANASEEVRNLVNELAKLDDLEETDEIAQKWERLGEIAPNIYSAMMRGDEWQNLKKDILSSASAVENLGEEIDEALTQETGDLESKLERLKDLAEEYGMKISQRDRNTLESLIDQDNEKELTGSKADRLSELQEKIDAADEALIAFEEQYDKIILKLENGKKVEILPNDKGLRDLYKFMDEGDGRTFNGIDVADVEYVRAEQFVTTQIESYEELCKVVQRYNELRFKGDKTSKEEKEYEALIKRINATDTTKDNVEWARIFKDFNGVNIDRLAKYLGFEIPQSAEKSEAAIDETNQKLREQEDLYQQVRTAIKGTLEEVVGMDYTAVALEDIEREIKDGLITTLEDAITRFKEMNNIAEDVRIAAVGEYERVAEDWDRYQGNKYVDEDNETVIKKSEYDLLEQKKSEIEDLKTTAEEARIKFLQLTQSLDADLFAGYYDEFSLGQSKAELDRAQQELQELANDGHLAAEAMEEINAAYQKTSSSIAASYEGLRSENMFKEDAGSYELGYHDAEKRYEQTHIDDVRENNELRKTIETLEKELRETQQRISSGSQIGDSFREESEIVTNNIKAEIDALKRLEDKIFDVKHAVEQKIKAFVNEKNAVASSVANELTELNKLKEKLDVIAGQVKAIGKISIVDQPKEKKSKEKKSKPLDDTPIKGEQLDMDLDSAVQDTKELAVAEEKVEAAVEQTNDALDEQVAKEKELIKQKGTLNFLENQSKEYAKTASTKWSDEQKEAYEQLIAKIQEYKKSKNKLTDEELNSIRQIVNGYKIQAQTIINAQESAEKASKAFGLKELNKATGSKNNLEALSRGFDSKAVKDGLESVRVAYEALSDAQKKFNDGHNPTDEEEIAYKNLVNQYNEAAKALDNLFKASKKMSDNGRWSAPIEQSDLDNIYKLETAMQNAIRAAENGRVKFGQFNKETGELEYSVRRSNGTWDHFKAQVDQAGMAVVGLNGKIKTTNGIIRDFTGGIATKFKSAMQVFSGYDLFFEGVAQVKKGVQYVRDIDTALTELKKVTNETDEAYAQFLQTASKTAGVVGSTVKDITTMTADWSRLNI